MLLDAHSRYPHNFCTSEVAEAAPRNLVAVVSGWDGLEKKGQSG